MKQPKINLAETVVIIDAAHYNFVTSDMKRYFENRLNRTLNDIDISVFATDLALDSGIQPGNNEIQLLWVYDEQSSKLTNSMPSDLQTELNGVAFKNQLGEFSFAGVPCSGLVSREDLFLDLLNITADSADAKRIILVPNDKEYKEKVDKAVAEITEKEVILFRMEAPQEPGEHRIKSILFPLLHAFGINGEEL